MTLAQIKTYCLSKTGADEDFPFDFTTMVFKVGGKIFALTDINDNPLKIALKCDPFLAQNLRLEYPAVTPGYHLNKQHWNTVTLDGSINDATIREWIDHSYELVFNTLTKGKQMEIIKAKKQELK